jgi:hypothetical protein
MSRDLTQTLDINNDPSGDPKLREAIDIDGSYAMVTRAEIYPSRMYFEGTDPRYDSAYAIAGADSIGVQQDVMWQEIIYSTDLSKLVTFFSDGDHLNYCLEGSTTIITKTDDCTAKPGAIGTKIFLADGNVVTRYTVTYGSPITLASDGGSYTYDTGLEVVAVHAVSSTQAVAIVDSDGGFAAYVMDGTSHSMSPIRFMFPTLKPYDKSTYNMFQQGIASGAALLGDDIFVYISNASTGIVEGMSYNTVGGEWSDIFTAVPTDEQVSQCSLKIANVYTHNGTIYMCGQFARTDVLRATDMPYSLLLYSTDGKTFSIDRFVLVSNIGYRFLATVGNDTLYLANCNRICKDDVTWVFDGETGTGVLITIPQDHIKGIQDQDNERCTISLTSGRQEYWDIADVREGAKIILYLGMLTGGTPEAQYIKFGTYIIDNIDYGVGSGSRTHQLNCMSLSMWRLSGLSMPFYAEILGKSVHYDPLLLDTTTLSGAGNIYMTHNKMSIDFWHHKEYSTGTIHGGAITGLKMLVSGGVDMYQALNSNAPHCYGLIMDSDFQSILFLDENPLITATTIDVEIYGWSRPIGAAGNDIVHLLVITEDEEGNEKRWVSTTESQWEDTESVSSYAPISLTFPDGACGPAGETVFTVGEKIKKMGLILHCDEDTWFNVARIDVTSGIEAHYTYLDGEADWEMTSDGVFTVPSSGRPFVMYSQYPYNMQEISIHGCFENTTVPVAGLESYPLAAGLACFGSDHSNCIVARYNQSPATPMAELIMIRNNVETLLIDEPVSFNLGDLQIMKLDHKGGHFVYSMWNADDNVFEVVLTYDWEEANGFMFVDENDTMKCGIYGYIASPFTRILGYYNGESETGTNADGIGVDPVFDLTGWPASGTLRIGVDTLSYGGKIAHPTDPQGPYQFRQGGIYAADQNGHGESALETRGFNWLGTEGDYTGSLIAVDSGANFDCTGSLWQIFDTDGGVIDWLPGRCRLISDNAQIGEIAHSLGNKVWLVGGFHEIHQTSTSTVSSKHSEGELATFEIAGSIVCHWYMGAGGEDDTVVEDMIDRVCRLSGATAVFTGDNDIGTLVVGAPAVISRVPYADGLDINFYVAAIGATPLDFIADIKITNTHEIDITDTVEPEAFRTAIENDTSVMVRIEDLGSGDYQFSVYSYPTESLMYSTIYTTTDGAHSVRVLFFGNNISFYMDSQWITSKCFYELQYCMNSSDLGYLNLSVTGDTTLTNVLIKEMSDWREAIYIDLETDGMSALNSIIQQRCVEQHSLSDGSIEFYYEITRPEIPAVREPRSHRFSRSVPTDGASDAIIYSAIIDGVRTMQNPDFARELGFATKMFRMPDLTVGATRATYLLLKKMYESYRSHNLVIRPDLELMVGDIYPVSYTASGDGYVENRHIIVESVNTSLKMSGNKVTSAQSISGRETDNV